MLYLLSASEHSAACLLREVVLGRLDVVHGHIHFFTNKLLPDRLASLEHPWNVVQRLESFRTWRLLALLIRSLGVAINEKHYQHDKKIAHTLVSFFVTQFV